MKLLIFLMIAFLVVVYVYTFIKIHKKRQQRSGNTVSEFNKKYHSKKKTAANADKDTNTGRYITKYNSKLDYIAKDELKL